MHSTFFQHMIENMHLLPFALLTVLGFLPSSSSLPDRLKHVLEELSGSNLRISANIVSILIHSDLKVYN